MAHNLQRVVIAATPTAPLLPHLLHALSHKPHYSITVLTRETSISLSNSSPHNHHDHNHSNGDNHTHTVRITHTKTSFSPSELASLLKDQDILICIFTGSDLHLSASLTDAASSPGSKIKLFIPSEYGLDTANPAIRELLPPYRTRYEIQEKLRGLGLAWEAIYSGLVIEDAMKTDGVLGIDVLWASAVVFPDTQKTKVAISTYPDIAAQIVKSLDEEGRDEVVYASSFMVTIGEVIEAVEKELDREVDRYEGDLEGARKEASERMKMGFFDGGVALMGRVAAWDTNIRAWGSWKDGDATGQGKWKQEVKKVVRMVREGKIGGDGCGC